MTRDGPQAGVGGSDQRSAAAGVAGPHPPHPLGEILDILFRQSAAHVPEEHSVPTGGERGERVCIADVDVGQVGRRRDQPDAGPLRLGEQVSGRGSGEPHAIEAESRDRFERFAMVIEAAGKEGQPAHLQHASRERGGLLCRGLHGRHGLGERGLPHGERTIALARCGWLGLRGSSGNDTLHP